MPLDISAERVASTANQAYDAEYLRVSREVSSKLGAYLKDFSVDITNQTVIANSELREKLKLDLANDVQAAGFVIRSIWIRDNAREVQEAQHIDKLYQTKNAQPDRGLGNGLPATTYSVAPAAVPAPSAAVYLSITYPGIPAE